MQGHTLIAIMTTNRSDMEYLARTRTEIIETLDSLRLDNGDVIQITMQYVPNSELEGLQESSPDKIIEWEAGGYTSLLKG